MATLAMGVTDTPYDDTDTTTGDVAKILEDEYGLMAMFAKKHMKAISAQALQDARVSLKNAMAGRPPTLDLSGTTALIEREFVEYINRQEHGIVTKASLGRTGGRRLKGKEGGAKAKGISFVDTGAYRASIKAWQKDNK